MERGVIIKERPVVAISILTNATTSLVLTVDAPISCNSQHAAGDILLFTKLHTAVYQPLLVFGCSNSALDPAGCDIVYADRLLVA